MTTGTIDGTGTTEADRIAADGVQFRDATGTTRTLRYDLAAIRAIESTFGSLAAAVQGLDQDARSPVFTRISDLLRCGIVNDAQPGALMGEAEMLTVLRDLPARLKEYMQIFDRAFRQAFPDAVDGLPNDLVLPSPGGTGTTSPPSSPTEANGSSGG
jgi:hypothetical protein